jgi:hypothetical protein
LMYRIVQRSGYNSSRYHFYNYVSKGKGGV